MNTFLSHFSQPEVVHRITLREHIRFGLVADKHSVLVVGAGPCGLRAAVETQLMGARTVVIEKRTGFTRNNVLKLWKFLIDDLKMLGE